MQTLNNTLVFHTESKGMVQNHYINLSSITNAVYEEGANESHTHSSISLHFGSYRLCYEGEIADAIYKKLTPAIKKRVG